MLRIKFVSNPDKWGLSEVKKGGPVDLKGSWHRVKIKIIDGLYYDAMCIYGEIPDDADVVIYTTCDEPGTPIKGFKYGNLNDDYELVVLDELPTMEFQYMLAGTKRFCDKPLSDEVKAVMRKAFRERAAELNRKAAML